MVSQGAWSKYLLEHTNKVIDTNMSHIYYIKVVNILLECYR